MAYLAPAHILRPIKKHLILITVALALVVAACTGGGDDAGVATLEEPTETTTTTPAEALVDAESAMLDYTACLRDLGLDVEYPGLDANGNPRFPIITGLLDMTGDDPAAAAAAMEDQLAECEHLVEGITFTSGDPAAGAESEDQMLAYAECMREHGIDMDDPNFSADGQMQELDIEDIGALEEADEACRKVFVGSNNDA